MNTSLMEKVMKVKAVELLELQLPFHSPLEHPFDCPPKEGRAADTQAEMSQLLVRIPVALWY